MKQRMQRWTKEQQRKIWPTLRMCDVVSVSEGIVEV